MKITLVNRWGSLRDTYTVGGELKLYSERGLEGVAEPDPHGRWTQYAS